MVVKKNPLWKNICEELAARIEHAVPGERFMTIAELCDEFSVSAITACRVFAELEKSGLITKKPRIGSIVRERRDATRGTLIWLQASYEVGSNSAFLLRVLQSMTVCAERANYDLKLVNTAIDADELATLSASGNPVGVFCFEHISPEALAVLLHVRCPFVVFNPLRPLPAGGSLMIDHVNGSYIAAKHALELGHRRIAILRGSFDDPYFNWRFNGYVKAFYEYGVNLDMNLLKITVANDSSEQGAGEIPLRQAFEELFADPALAPSAILCNNDGRALELMEMCREKNVAVPEQLSIIGYDDTVSFQLKSHPLTTVSFRYDDICMEVFSLLERLRAGNCTGAEISSVMPELVVRASSSTYKAH